MTKKPIPIKEYARWAKEQKSKGSNERRGEQKGQEAMWERGLRQKGAKGRKAEGAKVRRGRRGKCPLFFTAVLDVIGFNLLSAYHPKLNEPSKN